MNKKDNEKFKKLLLEEKLEIAEELKKFAKQNPDVEGDWESEFPNFEKEDFDIEEAADEVEEYINRLPLEHAFEEKLKLIDEALKRIKKGTYGKCLNCNKNIPKKRLKAIPETKFCLDCANKQNKGK
ncbi:MAG: TraR/DksA family transcriptional regulator [Candidatus Spechtbacterales bacterium]|nr:TraR/DksA family transcriptional regulator [Candidatus Spechtbacterales bacterium]